MKVLVFLRQHHMLTLPLIVPKLIWINLRIALGYASYRLMSAFINHGI